MRFHPAFVFPKARRRFLVALTLFLATAVVWCASPAAAQLDATCVGSITLNFNPALRLALPAPHAIATASGTITSSRPEFPHRLAQERRTSQGTDALADHEMIVDDKNPDGIFHSDLER